MTRLRHALLEEIGVEHGFGVRGAVDPPGVWRPRQVHGADVATASQCESGRVEADAVLAAEPGVRVGVVTADCLPILATTEDGRAVAAIHAGWRGLAQGVIETGIAALRREAGASGSSMGGGRLRAIIGPHVGACCYEVDEPVLSALSVRYGPALAEAVRPARGGHVWLDLGRLGREALRAAAIEADLIGALEGACTCCDPERFHSYRRDGRRAGRLLHFVRTAKP